MKLTVNLLSAELLPKQNLLTLLRVVMSWALVLLIVIAAVAYQKWQAGIYNQQKQALTVSQKQLQQQQKILAQAMASRRVSEKLKAEVGDAEKELAIKQQLVAQITKSAQYSKIPFSVFLKDLALVREHQLWLDGISLAEHGVTLTGYAANAAVIPEWLNQVAEQGYLQGTTFSQLAITEAERWHRFELTTPVVIAAPQSKKKDAK